MGRIPGEDVGSLPLKGPVKRLNNSQEKMQSYLGIPWIRDQCDLMALQTSCINVYLDI